MGTPKLHIHNVYGWNLTQKIQVFISILFLIEIDLKVKWPYIQWQIYSGMKVNEMSHEKQNTRTY